MGQTPEGGAATALRRRLDQGLAALGADIDAAVDAEARERMIRFLGLLVRWNRAYNLTAVRDPDEMVPRHLLDSLAILPWVVRGPVLDLGTGAGLPGIPLALVRSDLRFTLLDGNGKKIRFVRHAAAELGLTNVDAVQARVETYRPPRKFATIVARAVASLTTLHAACTGLASADGRLLALKGRLPTDEMDELAAAMRANDRSAPIAVHPVQVPLLDGERNLIEIPFHANPNG